ncbi:hypothetical protein [uncultured Kordia sp.]|uniref:hypothetical protein n=1 Tax=uncultured Kordia sp. TaxID=507699 RepID=UPI002617F9C3|nr:hypothetical protein [uncultured Kordia sp.]
MKKQQLKSLALNKKTISDINAVLLKGGLANSGAAAATGQTVSGVTFTFKVCSTHREYRTNFIFCG